MLTIQVAISLSMLIPQGATSITVPDDIKVWGGISLAAAFRFGLVPLLTAFKVITERNKKTIGYVLIGLGAAVGLAYSVGAGNVDVPVEIITNVAAGALAGAGAVGLHSAPKNYNQWREERRKEK